MPTKRSGRGPYPDLNQAYFRLPWNLGEDRVLYIRDCSFKILSLWNILVGGLCPEKWSIFFRAITVELAIEN